MAVEEWEHLRDDLFIFHDCVNAGVLRAGRRALVIECGSGAVAEAAGALGCTGVDWALATHYHRDSCWGLEACRARGATVAVPAAERGLFEHVERYWAAGATRFHRYGFRPSTNVLARSVPADRALADGEVLTWHGYRLTAVATPGHTDGSLSYVLDTGRTLVAFVGDLLYGEGRFWELWSLQGPPPGDPVGAEDYHAFCGRARQAVDSLARLLDRFAPVILVPAHGPVIREPAAALTALGRNVEALLANYYRTSSMRYYFPAWTARQSGQAREPLPGIVVEPPAWFRVGPAPTTTRAIVAPSGRAVVMDCGASTAVDGVQRWLADGVVTGVDAVWVSHYHDDHVGGIGELVARTGCAVWAGRSIAGILEQPAAYCMPCLDPTPVPIDRVLEDGARMEWEGYTLTAYDFPGQTLLHSALLVERGEVRLLICGDALTPAGIDDYCAQNRNLLGQGQGYLACLDLVERLRPTMLVNMHVERPFTLPAPFLAEIRAALQARERLLARLVPWEGCNFGLDPQWARCFPYHQQVAAGTEGTITLCVTNHGPSSLAVDADLLAPPGWQRGETVRREVRAGGEGVLVCPFRVPHDSAMGRQVLGVRLKTDGRDLGPWAEALVDVMDARRGCHAGGSSRRTDRGAVGRVEPPGTGPHAIAWRWCAYPTIPRHDIRYTYGAYHWPMIETSSQVPAKSGVC